MLQNHTMMPCSMRRLEPAKRLQSAALRSRCLRLGRCTLPHACLMPELCHTLLAAHTLLGKPGPCFGAGSCSLFASLFARVLTFMSNQEKMQAAVYARDKTT